MNEPKTGGWDEDVSDVEIDKLHSQEVDNTKSKPLVDPAKVTIKFKCNEAKKIRFLKIINMWNRYDERTPLMKETGLHLGALKDIVAFVSTAHRETFRPEIDTILIDVKIKSNCNKCGGRGYTGVLTTPKGFVKPQTCKCLKYSFEMEKGEEDDI